MKRDIVTEVVIPRTREFDGAVLRAFGGFGWRRTEADGHHFRSALPSADDVNAHLIWIFGMLDLNRKLLRSMAQSGVRIVCKCKWTKSRPVVLQAKALAMAHLLGVDLEVY